MRDRKSRKGYIPVCHENSVVLSLAIVIQILVLPRFFQEEKTKIFKANIVKPVGEFIFVKKIGDSQKIKSGTVVFCWLQEHFVKQKVCLIKRNEPGVSSIVLVTREVCDLGLVIFPPKLHLYLEMPLAVHVQCLAICYTEQLIFQ